MSRCSVYYPFLVASQNDVHAHFCVYAHAHVHGSRYWPNFYDYRVKKVTCSGCYDYDYRDFSAWLMRSDVLDALGVCGHAGYDAFDNNQGGCISMGSFDSGVSTSAYTQDLGNALDAGVPVTL